MKTGLESLDTGAPEITYSGNEGPKSPQQMQQMQQMQMAQLEEEYQKYVFEMEEQGLEPVSMQQFLEQIAAEAQMSSNEEGIGSMMQEPREMAAGGGIMKNVKGQDHMLAYITPGEANTLEDLGGQKTMTPEGIPAYPPPGEKGGAGYVGSSSGAPPGQHGGSGPTFQEQKSLSQPIQDRIQRIGSGIEPGYRPEDEPPDSSDEDPGSKIDDRIKPPKLPSPFTFIKDKAKKFKAWNNAMQRRAFLKQLKVGPGGLGDIDYDEDYLLSPEGLKKLNQLGYQNYLNRFQQPGDSGGQGQGITSQYPLQTASLPAAEAEDPATIENEFVANFLQPNRNLSDIDLERVNRIGAVRAADGGRIGYAGGGITDLRQGYFLGKLVKKATRGIKKLVKSPVGKAALLLGGGYLMNAGKFGGVGEGFFSNMFSSDIGEKIKNKLLMEKLKDDTYSGFDPFKIGILGASALTGLYAKKDQDDEPSLDDYMKSASRGPSLDPQGIRQYIASNKGRIDPSQYAFLQPEYYAADGGRIGLKEGLTPRQAALSAMYGEDDDENNMYKFANGGSAGLPPVSIAPEGFNSQSFPDDESTGITQATPQNPMPMPMRQPMMNPMMNRGMMSMQQPRIMAQEGGLMNLGGMEKDYRAEGGFVPIGGEERADDVPARLSKNEFVFTADAVRNAGGGDIDKGAEVMENMMENLEAGGKVSQQSQGLEGAREMFATQQRLGEVL